jgi:hypothetical protein
MSNSVVFAEIDRLLLKMTSQELLAMAKMCHSRAIAKSKIDLKVGDKVSFDTKSCGNQTGVLIKKNTKTFKVLVNSVTWKVSPTLLKKVA